MTHPFPTLAQHHINRAPLGLQFLPWEKENPEWTSSLPSTAGPFLGDPLKYYITRITKESEKLKREAKLKISSTQIFSSVQSFSHVRLFVTPWTVACQASLSITNIWSLLKFMSIESVMPSNNLILCRPLFLLPSIFPSIKVFSSESVLHIRWPKYWSFSFSISPSNEYSGLISFRIDWLDLLAVQETLENFLQHHSSKASILQHSAFFIVQLSHPYMTTVKTIALTRWTFVGKVMYLLFNTLSRLATAFLPRTKCLLISWLQSPSAVILLDYIPAHSSTPVEIPTRGSAFLQSQPSGLRELS